MLCIQTDRLKLFSESLMRSSFLKQSCNTLFRFSRSRSSLEIIEILFFVRRNIVLAGPNILSQSDKACSSSSTAECSSLCWYSTVSKVIFGESRMSFFLVCKLIAISYDELNNPQVQMSSNVNYLLAFEKHFSLNDSTHKFVSRYKYLEITKSLKKVHKSSARVFFLSFMCDELVVI